MNFSDRPSVLFPLIVSITLYIGIILSLTLYLKSNDQIIKRYTSKKDDFLEIAIIDKNRAKNIVKPAKKKSEKKVEKKSPPKKEKKKSPPKTAKKKSVGVKSLFGKIKTKDIKTSKTSKKPPAKQSRLKSAESKTSEKKSNKASKLASSLSLEESPILSKSASSGEYDKFRGEVQEILDSHWNQTEDTVEPASAEVKIDIDKNGNFSYTIVNLSYNNAFNEKLREFLEKMKDVKFPLNSDNVPPMNIKFSSQWSNR